LVSTKTLDEISSAAVPTVLGTRKYGYGWFAFDFSGHQVVEHHGMVFGFVSRLTRYPEDLVTIIILSNYDVIDTDTISRDLAVIVFDDE
jgi:hypothetical protein